MIMRLSSLVLALTLSIPLIGASATTVADTRPASAAPQPARTSPEFFTRPFEYQLARKIYLALPDDKKNLSWTQVLTVLAQHGVTRTAGFKGFLKGSFKHYPLAKLAADISERALYYYNGDSILRLTLQADPLALTYDHINLRAEWYAHYLQTHPNRKLQNLAEAFLSQAIDEVFHANTTAKYSMSKHMQNRVAKLSATDQGVEWQHVEQALADFGIRRMSLEEWRSQHA